ncbi:hypothetical protein TSHO111613_24685 [Tsukamurella hominis]
MTGDELDPPPDGTRWPSQFGVDLEWADDRGTAWRAVMNHPALQGRRRGDLLDLRTTGATTVHTYQLTAAISHGTVAYLATKEP